MPWQGKIWVGIMSISLFIILLTFFILLIFYGLKINFIILLLIIFYLFNLILVFSFLRGQKWSAQVSLGFGFIDVFRNARDVFIVLFVTSEFDFINFSVDVLFLSFSLFVLYLSWFCLKHPYFNQNKKLKE